MGLFHKKNNGQDNGDAHEPFHNDREMLVDHRQAQAPPRQPLPRQPPPPYGNHEFLQQPPPEQPHTLSKRRSKARLSQKQSKGNLRDDAPPMPTGRPITMDANGYMQGSHRAHRSQRALPFSHFPRRVKKAILEHFRLTDWYDPRMQDVEPERWETLQSLSLVNREMNELVRPLLFQRLRLPPLSKAPIPTSAALERFTSSWPAQRIQPHVNTVSTVVNSDLTDQLHLQQMAGVLQKLDHHQINAFEIDDSGRRPMSEVVSKFARPSHFAAAWEKDFVPCLSRFSLREVSIYFSLDQLAQGDAVAPLENLATSILSTCAPTVKKLKFPSGYSKSKTAKCINGMPNLTSLTVAPVFSKSMNDPNVAWPDQLKHLTFDVEEPDQQYACTLDLLILHRMLAASRRSLQSLTVVQTKLSLGSGRSRASVAPGADTSQVIPAIDFSSFQTLSLQGVGALSSARHSATPGQAQQVQMENIIVPFLGMFGLADSWRTLEVTAPRWLSSRATDGPLLLAALLKNLGEQKQAGNWGSLQDFWVDAWTKDATEKIAEQPLDVYAATQNVRIKVGLVVDTKRARRTTRSQAFVGGGPRDSGLPDMPLQLQHKPSSSEVNRSSKHMSKSSTSSSSSGETSPTRKRPRQSMFNRKSSMHASKGGRDSLAQLPGAIGAYHYNGPEQNGDYDPKAHKAEMKNMRASMRSSFMYT